MLRYRDMMRRMDEADLRLLMRDCEEFARQHPDQAGLVEFRKDAYLLDRLEGLQQSARLHMARATAEAVDGLEDHFAHVAADAANAVAETMGYGSSFHAYDDDAVRQFVGRPWSDGESFSEKIWKDSAKLAEYVNGDMAKAIVRGDSWQKLRGEIATRFKGQSASNIMRVVQTEGTYVARQARGLRGVLRGPAGRLAHVLILPLDRPQEPRRAVPLRRGRGGSQLSAAAPPVPLLR